MTGLSSYKCHTKSVFPFKSIRHGLLEPYKLGLDRQSPRCGTGLTRNLKKSDIGEAISFTKGSTGSWFPQIQLHTKSDMKPIFVRLRNIYDLGLQLRTEAQSPCNLFDLNELIDKPPSFDQELFQIWPTWSNLSENMKPNSLPFMLWRHAERWRWV
jgi:hypothetical protein